MQKIYNTNRNTSDNTPSSLLDATTAAATTTRFNDERCCANREKERERKEILSNAEIRALVAFTWKINDSRSSERTPPRHSIPFKRLKTRAADALLFSRMGAEIVASRRERALNDFAKHISELYGNGEDWIATGRAWEERTVPDR